MKKLIIPILILFLMVGAVLATNPLKVERYHSPLESLFSLFSTVEIGGLTYTCSERSDDSGIITASGTGMICRTAEGVPAEIFQTYSTDWNFIKEYPNTVTYGGNIPESAAFRTGDDICLSGFVPYTNYYWAAYYCSEMQLSTCTDSDGLDASRAGYITIASINKYYDVCIDSSTVKEAVCPSTGLQPVYTEYTCSDLGWDRCEDGRCVDRPVCLTDCSPQGAEGCSDSNTMIMCAEVSEGCWDWVESDCPTNAECLDGKCISTEDEKTITCYKCIDTVLDTKTVTAVSPVCPTEYSTIRPTTCAGETIPPVVIPPIVQDESMVVLDRTTIIKECIGKDACIFNQGETITVSFDVYNNGNVVINNWNAEAGVYPDDWLIKEGYGTKETFGLMAIFSAVQQVKSCQDESFVGRAIITGLDVGETQTVTVSMKVPSSGTKFADGTAAFVFDDDNLYPHKSYQIASVVSNKCWTEGVTDFKSDTSVLAGPVTGTNLNIRECLIDANCPEGETCTSEYACEGVEEGVIKGIPRDEVATASSLTLLQSLCEIDGESLGDCETGSSCSSIYALSKAGDLDEVEAESVVRVIEKGFEDSSIFNRLDSWHQIAIKSIIGPTAILGDVYDWLAGKEKTDKQRAIALCVVKGHSFDIMKWIEEKTGLTGIPAYVLIGAVVLIFLYIINMLLNPKGTGGQRR